MGRKRNQREKESIIFKSPSVYVKIMDFLVDNHFTKKRSLLIRDAVKYKIKHVCKTIQDSDEFFKKKHTGVETVSFRIDEEQLTQIEVLIRLGFYSSRSDFLREALSDYLENQLKVYPKLLREKRELEKNKVLIVDLTSLNKRIKINGKKITSEGISDNE